MEWMTHLASIAIGVAIAFFFLGGDKSKAAETASAPASSGATKKKKKKNKKKAKAAETAPVAAVPVVKEAAPVAEEKPVVVEKAAAPAAPTNGGKKKKNNNNNKKKNNGAAKATPAPTPAPVPEPKPEVAKPAPAPKPAPAIVPLQPRIVVEEEWATIPKKSKKKKKPVVKAAAAAASSDAKPEVSKASVTVTIDASRVGIIIGPKGATMNAIQEKTGTKLDVNAPKAEDNGSQFRPVVGGKAKAKATVVITEGTSEGMKLAKKAILELADRGYAALLQAEGFGESSVSVHPRFLSEIVGTGGKIIKAIQTELDVKLTIPKTDWTPKTIQVRNRTKRTMQQQQQQPAINKCSAIYRSSIERWFIVTIMDSVFGMTVAMGSITNRNMATIHFLTIFHFF